MVRRRHAGLSGKALGSESVAADFGAASEVARQGVVSLLDALENANRPEVAAARRQWMITLQATFGRDERRLEKGLNALAAAYATRGGGDPLALLFAVQTYYVLVVKFLVWQVVASAHRSDLPAHAIRDAAGSDRLLRLMLALESDGIGLGRSDAPARDDPFAWYTWAWSPLVEESLRRVAGIWQRYDFASAIEEATGAGDLLKTLYQEVFPKKFRHVLGEYYTPDWLVDQMLDEAGYAGESASGLLDPACGSGAFLVAAIRRLRARWAEQDGRVATQREALCRAILSGVAGIDLNPLAVVTARANYLIAISDLLPRAGPVEVPVYAGDSILGRHEALHDFGQRFDYVVGNPPWIAWDDLPPDYREATKPLWEHYGLFTLSGSDARHGGGKKDLSILMIYAAADRYLKPSGRLAMVVTQTVFQTRGAGDGFRRFRLGRAGEWLKVVQVNDMVELRPFPGTANWTATVVLEKGSPTTYPVPYVKYSADRSRRDFDAIPIDPQRSRSPWFLWPRGWSRPAAELIGPSDYKAHLGANTGGANGVYWLTLCGDAAPNPVQKPVVASPRSLREMVRVRGDEQRDGLPSGASLSDSPHPSPLPEGEGVLSDSLSAPPDGLIRVRNVPERGKYRVPAVERLVEAELLYPLLRWGDVDRFCAVPAACVLLAQDAETRRGIAEPMMRERYPNAHAYLAQFRDVLERRAAYRRYQSQAAFYSMYDVGSYTLAPIKVVWRRMDRRIHAAVVEPFDDPRLGLRPVIPQETCVLVAADSANEAHYLCAVLNSSLVGSLVASHSVRGGKSFGSPGMLDFLPIRRYASANPLHRELAEASRLAHDLKASGNDCAAVQERIDVLGARLWGLQPSELAALTIGE